MMPFRCFLALAAGAFLTGCQTTNVSAPKTGEVEHVVLVWLKEPGNAENKARMTAVSKSFIGQIDGIVSLTVGDPVPSDREMVDDSFDLALVIRFANKAALAAYDTHPVHTAAVAEVLAPLAARVVIYDAIVR